MWRYSNPLWEVNKIFQLFLTHHAKINSIVSNDNIARFYKGRRADISSLGLCESDYGIPIAAVLRRQVYGYPLG